MLLNVRLSAMAARSDALNNMGSIEIVFRILFLEIILTSLDA